MIIGCLKSGENFRNIDNLIELNRLKQELDNFRSIYERNAVEVTIHGDQKMGKNNFQS